MTVDRKHIDDMVQRYAFRWLIVFVVFIMLGSFYPFQLGSGAISQAVENWYSMPGLAKSDLAINVVAGFPIGLLGVLWIAGKDRQFDRLVRASILTLSFSLLFSTWVEIAQYWVRTRVPSRFDTAAQCVGAILGITLAIVKGPALYSSVAQLRARGNKINSLLDIYLIGYLVFMLQPFVPSVSPSELADKWRAGTIDPIPFTQWSTSPWNACYTLIVSLSTAVPVGVWVAKRIRGGLLRLGSIAVFVVCSLELAQMVIEMRTASSDDAVWSAVGALLGVTTGARMEQAARDLTHRFGDAIFLAGLLVVTSAYFLASLAPFEFVASYEELARRLTLWRGNPLGLGGNDFISGSNLVRVALWTVPLGLFAVLGFRSLRSGVLFAAVLVASFSAFCEAAQLLSVQHSPSLLAVLARICGGTMGIASVVWLRQSPKNEPSPGKESQTS